MPLADCDLLLLRHAPAITGGRLCGRTDVPADLSDRAAVLRLADALNNCARVVTSPALRCRQTAESLWPGRPFLVDEALWEQDFGVEDGAPLASLPDLGVLDRGSLARRQPQGGESFLQMSARAGSALRRLAHAGPVAVIAHAGTVRAGLALALGDAAAALAFEIAPLSVTHLRRFGQDWSIASVNSRP
ncbi:MAG: histidine phosphatase family protein [Paracoccus sp. (in: a-proteobacteria)]|nr:histidine phosphatase family protein [Paracoccus sp. (in: a-proteobacteria)]